MKIQEHTLSAHNFEECMKCTICTAYCPVVPVNPLYPGPKQAGPDGERLRLKDPYFFNKALKYCMNCKRCEVACPSGVNVADIIQEARMKYDDSPVRLRDRLLASTDFMGSAARPFSHVVNAVTGLKLSRLALDATLGIDSSRVFPKYSFRGFEGWLRRHRKEQAAFDKQVAYYHGCYVEYNYPKLGKDLVKILNALGIGVKLLEGERCCGVAMISNGMYREATRNAKRNLEAIRKATADGLKVVTTSSSCTFTIRNEYPALLGEDNSDVRDSILMATRFICQALESSGKELKFRDDINLKVAYHTPCHLAKLGWSIFSLQLLRMIPGVETVLLEDNCCGIAGTYGFKKENSEASQKIGQDLFDEISAVNPDYVVTDCETCKWQIEMSTPYKVLNPISLLADSLAETLGE